MKNTLFQADMELVQALRLLLKGACNVSNIDPLVLTSDGCGNFVLSSAYTNYVLYFKA
jgi:hypothetical protein